MACKFYPWLKEIINERLLSAASVLPEAAGATGTSATPAATNGAAPGVKAKTKAANSTGTPVGTESKIPAVAAATPVGTVPATISGQQGTAKRQKTPSALNPLINHETARMRLLFAHNPRVASSPTSCPGEFTIRLLSSLVKSAPELADHFTLALLKLAQRLTREHLVHVASSSAKTGSSNASVLDNGAGLDSFGRNRVMATPALAIVDEWNQMQAGRSSLSVNNMVRHLKKRDAREDKQKKKTTTAAGAANASSENGVSNAAMKDQSAGMAGGASQKTVGTQKKKILNVASMAARKTSNELLILCYVLLSKCSFSTSDHRRLYTSLLVHCLESSTNIPLLLQITKIVAHLVTSDVRQLLTTKDKMTLLAKMSSFDRLNEISAMPLNEEYYRLVLKLCDPSDTKQSQLHISPTSQSLSLTSHFMAGLLAPDPKIRAQFLQYFITSAGPGPVGRLQLVLRQDWQTCGTRYWPVIAIETLLSAILPDSEPVVSEPRSDRPKAHDYIDAATPQLVAHAAFLAKHRHVKASEITDSLRNLAHIDLDIAANLWVNLFSATWNVINQPEQSEVASNLMKILASKFNKRDLNVPLYAAPRRINVVQTLMNGVVTVGPSVPVLTPELVLHLASVYDVWSCAVRICEFQVENPRLSIESRLRWIEALSSLCKQLSEDDLRIGLSHENVSQPETATALMLEALGCVHEAQEEYFKALSKAQSGRVSVEDVNLFELRLWEERWVGCAKQLCQWQLMNDFAKSTQNQDLLLDCAWKRGDWNSAKQLLLSPSMQSAAELGCAQTCLQRLYIAILDGDKRIAVDSLVAQTSELALQQWQGLPRVLSRAHIPLMHLFHKFVEVKESIQMMTDIKHASQIHTLPNLKPSINTWRERLPNKWEPILLWDDILTWRSHMFHVVKTTFSWSDAQMLACMHDSPWSVIKLAHTARKQHLPDVCLGALSKLYAVQAMDVQDAFSKLREQVSICYESSTDYTGGLSILNNTNLDYFSLRQKAEMFRLKALFLEAMGNLGEANQTFSHCLQICDSYGKGWLSWGHYCYRLFVEQKELNFASQTIACYLQAIHHRCNSARLMIARVLWLLSMDDQHGILIQAFETHGKQLPIWIWIIWIPQLLMALGRPEAPQVLWFIGTELLALLLMLFSPYRFVVYCVGYQPNFLKRCTTQCELFFSRIAIVPWWPMLMRLEYHRLRPVLEMFHILLLRPLMPQVEIIRALTYHSMRCITERRLVRLSQFRQL